MKYSSQKRQAHTPLPRGSSAATMKHSSQKRQAHTPLPRGSKRYVGRSVTKAFVREDDGEMDLFIGDVVEYDARDRLYRILYGDDDVEQVDHDELADILDPTDADAAEVHPRGFGRVTSAELEADLWWAAELPPPHGPVGSFGIDAHGEVETGDTVQFCFAGAPLARDEFGWYLGTIKTTLTRAEKKKFPGCDAWCEFNATTDPKNYRLCAAYGIKASKVQIAITTDDTHRGSLWAKVRTTGDVELRSLRNTKDSFICDSDVDSFTQGDSDVDAAA
jgi:hypothetical protein